MPTVYVNDKVVELGGDERLNCIQAAQKAGVEIPHYCWHPELSVVASCRMCLVEVGEKKPDGSVVMQPKVVPGCQTPVKDGTVVVSNSAKVKQAQAATLEYLLLNHPLDCPVCDQAGECGLQDYSYQYGHGYSRLQEPKTLKPDKDYIGDQITLFTDRCVMCSRCVRFTREVSGTGELQIINRGSLAEIDIFPDQPCNNKLAGNVVDICPVGALCSKDFLYQQRVWWLQSKNSVCPDCSTGCSIRIDQNENVLYRLKPRNNPQAQGHFMCDEGRFGWKYIQSELRLQGPEQRVKNQVVSRDWSVIIPAARSALEAAAKQQPKQVAAVLSPWMTVEEAYLLSSYLKKLSGDITLSLGPVRQSGVDDTYPKTVSGEAATAVKFTIRGEKCPNRRGVEMVLKHFQGAIIPASDLLGQVSAGKYTHLYLTGGDPAGWMTQQQTELLLKAQLLIVQDILQSPLTSMAHYVFAGGAFAERDGCFVNHAGLTQAIHRALRGPGDAYADGRILWELTGRTGLFHAAKLRAEISTTIPAFAKLGDGQLGEQGVFLE